MTGRATQSGRRDIQAQNLIIFVSDEHNPAFLGCAGHARVETPNLDRLAEAGVRFTRATTPSPICVPARASFATGQYVHTIGAWDNAHPYDGRLAGWAHELLRLGVETTAIGKLHYRAAEDDYGFTQSMHTMNVLNGLGDQIGLLRKRPIVRSALEQHAEIAGGGESPYTEFDRRVTSLACDWIKGRTSARSKTPWVLYVGFVMPHYPYIAPSVWYEKYANAVQLEPVGYRQDQRPQHPWIEHLSRMLPYDARFNYVRRQAAIAAYHGMVSFLDSNIGCVLTSLDESGLRDSTRILYTSDHGEMLGAHGLWGKCCMYEESVGVPMILSGADVMSGRVNATEVSLVDAYPTILDALGVKADNAAMGDRPGRSLFEVQKTLDLARFSFSEYHAVGSPSGCFMLRRARWKYVYYVGYEPQLFDIAADPDEFQDLAGDPVYATIKCELDECLRTVVDPEAVSAQAFASQEEKVRIGGGAEVILAESEDFAYTPPPAAG